MAQYWHKAPSEYLWGGALRFWLDEAAVVSLAEKEAQGPPPQKMSLKELLALAKKAG